MRSRFLIAYEPTLFNFGFFPQALLVRAQTLLLDFLGDLRFGALQTMEFLLHEYHQPGRKNWCQTFMALP